MEFYKTLQSLNPIPKIVHVSWNNVTFIRNEKNALLDNGYRQIEKLSKEYSVRFWDNDEIIKYVNSSFLLNKKEKKRLRNFMEIQDLFRWVLMYQEGGIYMDIDRLVNKNLSSIISPSTRFIAPSWRNQDFAQDFIGSSKGNPVFLKAIHLNSIRRQSLPRIHSKNDYLWLGCATYLHAVSETLTNKRILPQLHGPSYRNDEMRILVQNLRQFHPVILTKTEYSQCDTLVYKGNFCNHIHKNKMLLYARSKIKYWQYLSVIA